MENEVIETIKKYSFIKNELYKGYYITLEEDRGLIVDTSSNLPAFEKPVYNRFRSTGVIGENGPINNIGEQAFFKMYYHNDGLVELEFVNNGHCDEVKDFKHLMYLLDPKNLDLKKGESDGK